MTTHRSATLLAALGLLLGGRAHAGLLDSPPLSIGGESGKVVYRMGPVYYEPGHVDTVVSCTNFADGPTAMVLEVFDENDVLRATAYSAQVAANVSVTFATSSRPDIDGAVIPAGMPTVNHGKARVSATTARISCAAKTVVVSSDGDVKERPLELVKKVALGD
jgi:hypothetical protein